jgi:hypothetical protein
MGVSPVLCGMYVRGSYDTMLMHLTPKTRCCKQTQNQINAGLRISALHSSNVVVVCSNLLLVRAIHMKGE